MQTVFTGKLNKTKHISADKQADMLTIFSRPSGRFGGETSW